MAEKKTYWMVDANGDKALASGAGERDQLLERKWVESDDPQRNEFIWMTHSQTGGVARFATNAQAAWEARGWSPSGPPEPVDVRKDQPVKASKTEPGQTTASPEPKK